MDASLATRVVRQKWLSGLVALCWAAFLVSNLIRGRVITTAIDGAACLVALAAWAWARASPETRLNVCAQITLASSALALSGAASVGGMSRSVALWYLGGVPLIAGYTLGVRSAVRWAGGCIALVIAVYVMEVRGAPEQEFVPLPAELVFGRVVLLALLAAFAVAARRASDLYVAALKQQQQLTKAHAAAVVRQAEELAAARDEALAAGKAKGAFLAAISHEIRTPLNAVVGVAELLGRGSVSADQRRMVETIERSGRSLARIVNDVLQFSKLEAGGNAVEVAPFDLARCLDDVVDMVGAQARERGLALSATLEPGCPTLVAADEHLLRQVLVNLVCNGIKFTERGSVSVLARRTDRGLQFDVKDTGIGIDPAHRDLLFQPFSQLDTSMARRRGGTGLGLAISSRLVGLAGGSITLESTPGVGSTFSFTMDAQPATLLPPHQPAPLNDSPAPGLRVLLVEDNEANQLVLVSMLKHLGYTPDVVDSGQQAVHAVKTQPYDVVLMDMQMPEMDGLEATRHLHKALPKDRVPWIVALTANVLDEQRAACHAAGMHDFLAKPVDLRTLSDALKRARPPVAG